MTKQASSNASVTRRLGAALMELKNPGLTKVNPHYKSKYAPLEEILSVVKPVLNKYGFYFHQTVEGDEFWTFVTDAESGDKVLSACFPFPSFPDVQKLGGGLKYCRRYGLMLALGIVGEEDDDGNSALPDKPTKKGDGW